MEHYVLLFTVYLTVQEHFGQPSKYGLERSEFLVMM